MVIGPAEVDVCDADPGYPVDVQVVAALIRMVQLWRGDVAWSEVLRSGDVVLTGPERSRRALPDWFRLPPYAAAPRPVDRSTAER